MSISSKINCYGGQQGELPSGTFHGGQQGELPSGTFHAE